MFLFYCKKDVIYEQMDTFDPTNDLRNTIDNAGSSPYYRILIPM